MRKLRLEERSSVTEVSQLLMPRHQGILIKLHSEKKI